MNAEKEKHTTEEVARLLLEELILFSITEEIFRPKEFRKKYNVSVITYKRAIRILSDLGLIDVSSGKRPDINHEIEMKIKDTIFQNLDLLPTAKAIYARAKPISNHETES